MTDAIKKKQANELPPPPPPVDGFQAGALQQGAATGKDGNKITDSSIFKKGIEGLDSQEAAVDKTKEYMQLDVSSSIFNDLEATKKNAEKSIEERDAATAEAYSPKRKLLDIEG